jgi:hypothetical protein
MIFSTSARAGVLWLIVLLHLKANAQLSFLPNSSSEGIAGNTSVAGEASSLAPLANPATAAARETDDPSLLNQASISSNIYMLSNFDVRGRSDYGNIKPNFSSLPTSLGGRKRLAGAHTTFGVYQTEQFQFDYREAAPQGSSGRTTALLEVNRAAVAVAFNNEGLRYGFGLCLSSYSLKVNSQFISLRNTQLGALSSSWEERSRTDASISAGIAREFDSGVSFGLAVRSPSLRLLENSDGQRFFAIVSTNAGSSSLEEREIDDANQIFGNGIEGVIGLSLKNSETEVTAEVAMSESLGSSIGGLGGETQVRFGIKQQVSSKRKMIYGLMFGASELIGNELYPNRKSVPFTASMGLELDLDDVKGLSVGVFHNNAIDWELENTDRYSYSVLQRTGLVFSGAFSL